MEKKLPKAIPSITGVKPEVFYPLIGKLSLIHAGIEQDLKGVLIEDWNILEDEVEWRYGRALRIFFLKSIKELGISNNYYEQYSTIIERFWKASIKRNELLKASYGLVGENRSIFRYNPTARGKYEPEMDLRKWLQKGGRIISLKELQNLINELAQIREDNFQLSRKVFLEAKKNCRK